MIPELIALGAACMLLGLVVGLYISRWALRRQNQPAPVPVDIGYGPTNPINQAHFTDPVEVDGIKLWRVC